MSSTSWQRRSFLRALGAGAAALPFYKLLESSAVEGQDAASPLRLMVIYSAIGGRWDYLRPRGLAAGLDTALTPESLTFDNSVLQPLRDYTSRMTLIEGLAASSALIANDGGARTYYLGHERTAAASFTGSIIDDGTADAGPSSYLPRGPSVEFDLASRFGDTAVRSLQVGIGGSAGRFHNESISYDMQGRRLPALTSPVETFRTLFGDVGPDVDVAERERIRREQQSVLSAVQSSARRLHGRLGAVERTKLDAHMSALADIERRLRAPSGGPVMCSAPTPPTSDPPFDEAHSPDHAALQLETLVQAFACDRTRFVASTLGPFGFGGMTWLDASVNDLHNQVGHSVEGDTPEAAAGRLHMAQLNRSYAEELAAFMGRLDSIPENDGTVLDNSLIVWMTDFGHDTHSGLNVPVVLLGGAQHRLRMGRYLNHNSDSDQHDWQTFQPMNNLLVSILQAYGVETENFNSTEFSGALSGLA